MGLTKQYLAYHAIGTFNVIASAKVNISFITYNKTDGRYVAVGAAEKVFIWDLRLGEKIAEFTNGKDEVTALRPSPDKLHLAVGFSNGDVRIFNIQTTFSEERLVATFSIHRSGVNNLRYDSNGKLLLMKFLKIENGINNFIVNLNKKKQISRFNRNATSIWWKRYRCCNH